ncbi:MAG: cold shock domain-containing protein [Pseudomonadota bacterium]
MTDDRIVRGVVKWFDLAKGFGFVIAEGVEQDVLLHVNVVRRFGRSVMSAGDEVEISYGETSKGLQVIELVSVAAADEKSADGNPPAPHVDDPLVPARMKWFDKGKGYGFINVFGEDEDVFVHVDVLRAGGLLEAQVGEAMCAVITRGTKGASATSVYPWDAALAWKTAQQAS